MSRKQQPKSPEKQPVKQEPPTHVPVPSQTPYPAQTPVPASPDVPAPVAPGEAPLYREPNIGPAQRGGVLGGRGDLK